MFTLFLSLPTTQLYCKQVHLKIKYFRHHEWISFHEYNDVYTFTYCQFLQRFLSFEMQHATQSVIPKKLNKNINSKFLIYKTLRSEPNTEILHDSITK